MSAKFFSFPFGDQIEPPERKFADDVQPGEPNEVLVRALEATLDLAREGKLQSLVGAGFFVDGNRFSIWCEGDDVTYNYYEARGSLQSLLDEHKERHPEVG